MGIYMLCLSIWLTFSIYLVVGQEDSLRSALNAVNRRQRDLSEYSAYNYYSNPSEVSFLPRSFSYSGEEDVNPAIDYYESEPEVEKRISSSFRERLEEDKEKKLEELAQRFLSNLENEEKWEDNDEYVNYIQDNVERYRNHPRVSNKYQNKRNYYPRFGESARKRTMRYPYEYHNSDTAYLSTNELDDYRNSQENRNNWNPYYERKSRFDRFHTGTYPHTTSKRFPVAKRSSTYTQLSNEKKDKEKLSTEMPKTDPKVEKDLSNVFGSKKPEKTKTKELKDKSKNKEQQTKKLKSNASPKKVKTEKSRNKGSKEYVNLSAGEKPIQIAKKSIDWSDYFGLDRRKKSDELNKEWLMERYHKAVALTEKKNAEYPLQSFHKHDGVEKRKEDKTEDDIKIEQMDEKLKNMEDAIVDDALKYTGAHIGMEDSKESQEVKDRLISQLAAAYSLEKMRRALGEYKMTIEKERERLKQKGHHDDDFTFNEEKRLSVPRKQAVSSDKNVEDDNRIKCAQGDAECDETNYKTPPEVLEAHFDTEGCPKIQKACEETFSGAGQNARILEQACNLQQMCLLCGNNSWLTPTRQCNMLFLSKTFDLCDGQPDCQKQAQNSIRYLMEVHRSLRMEPLGDCDLACPDNFGGR